MENYKMSIKTHLKISTPFFKKGKDFLGVQYPIICGAMTWVSEPNLVAAVCNAGGFGCLAGGNTPSDILKEQILRTKELTDKPFGVNLITIAPAYKEHLELVKTLNLPFIIFAGSFPKSKEIQDAKSTGAKVICFASTISIAKRMLAYGADALILEGMEAGGHVGHVSLTVLLQQVLFQVENVPVFVAGGIATGRMCAHMFLMGAAGVQMGTLFTATDECIAHENFKKRFISANARDAVSTPQFDSRLPVVAVRALKNTGHNDFSALQLDLINKLNKGLVSRPQAQMLVEEFWMGALRRAVIDGDIEKGSLMAGQSVGLVKSIRPVADVINNILQETEIELESVKEKLCGH
jgi:enoyl-[acyl-carrier protein] reductase II